MRVSLVLTIIGAERPGIVAEVATLAAAHDASWQDSRMARLAGQFAGIVALEVSEEESAALERALQTLESEGLQIAIGRDTAPRRPAGSSGIVLDLVGHDREGIVRDIAAALARHGVSIDELETGVEDASMSGERLFRARASLVLPDAIDLDALRGDLETIADELMVDLSLDRVRPEGA
jgi:glycine cleavage system regulatory protein